MVFSARSRSSDGTSSFGSIIPSLPCSAVSYHTWDASVFRHLASGMSGRREKLSIILEMNPGVRGVFCSWRAGSFAARGRIAGHAARAAARRAGGPADVRRSLDAFFPGRPSAPQGWGTGRSILLSVNASGCYFDTQGGVPARDRAGLGFDTVTDAIEPSKELARRLPGDRRIRDRALPIVVIDQSGTEIHMSRFIRAHLGPRSHSGRSAKPMRDHNLWRPSRVRMGRNDHDRQRSRDHDVALIDPSIGTLISKVRCRRWFDSGPITNGKQKR